MSGPCGLGIKPAGHYLLAGDETALPAIARIAERLPASALGAIFIEIDTPEDRLLLTVPPGISCQWIYRREGYVSADADFTAQVERSIAAGPMDHFVWIATEFAAYQALRRSLKAIAKPRSISVPYWRAGGRHDVNTAARFCDEIIVLHSGQLVARGTPDEVIRPDILRAIYGIDVGVMPHPKDGAPLPFI
ncbi:SIP domain-containing protein [Bosea vestrisii]|uniref:SIP domain-containing protein n=1 Tax=Bosea vestrisii TaxID=151416 RepID=UPI0024DFF54A|nr:SIP domain-containing protein [Bosea vestrisii]WID95351.1 SIP domain-containing protein [Bosea vestrisii]